MAFNNTIMLFASNTRAVEPTPEYQGFLLSHRQTFVFIAVWVLFLSYLWPQKPKKEAARISWKIPILKSTIDFLFDGFRMFNEIPRRWPNNETVRIDIFQDEIYAVQGPKNVQKLFNDPVLTNNKAYSLFLEQCYGMDPKAAKLFADDASGLREKPLDGTAVVDERIFQKTHKNMVDGLLNKGLPAGMENMERNLEQFLSQLPVRGDWVEMPSLTTFFERMVGTPLIETLYGRRLLEEVPDFIENLWTFDHAMYDILRRMPSWFFPKGYTIRKTLLAAIKRWQISGLQCAGSNNGTRPHQEDPVWGSEFMKDRYNIFLGAKSQTQESIASMNLGLFWGTVVNVVPSAEALMINLLQDPESYASIRQSLDEAPKNTTGTALDMAEVEKIPLLRSAYSETLRNILQIHIPRVAKHHNIRVNDVVVPQDKLIVANMMLAHMDTKVWNTQDGKHPVDTFWAQRFIVDPQDPTTGPVLPHIRQKLGYESDEPHYTTKGLDGAFIPFGGGKYACPGRKMARRVIVSSLAMLVSQFDVELMTEEPVRFDSPRFGLSVRAPNGPVPFRIRRRNP